ncbi:response regulator with CheY-like receiver domain and winged-helix DNA-binding domain [Herbaspirillum sp. CF444]|uniref:response regulator n=1 Tax=Herbaspirillum sp. CF444 TaxID=1144319 RepID=UPI0002724C49|nr:response regulator transcription factor [Herbaspirillum sp. CF444]EJL83360.1 response regulator with CheY-like receiver domain and winged-helix DNA-binding domain [Herbaspirillum sp. CF444]
MRILIVEDDAMIASSLRSGLKLLGHAPDHVTDAEAAQLVLDTPANAGVHDVMLLDLGLPRRSGMELLLQQRRRGSVMPVIIITARDSVAERIAGLNAGADDYLVKPFSLDELAARIQAVSRRYCGRAQNHIEIGSLHIDLGLHQVTRAGNPIALSSTEYELLALLSGQPDTVFSRAQLEDKLYGWQEEVSSNAVEVHIYNLRKKVGNDAVRNIRGAGYRIAQADELDS